MVSLLNALNFSMVKAHVNNTVKAYELSNDSLGFVHLMIEKIYPFKSLSNDDLITEGGYDRGVDAIYLRERDDNAIVDLLSFKYRTTARSAEKCFEENELDKIFSFVEDILDRNEECLKHSNDRIRDKISDIWSVFEAGRVCTFRIILCSNGRSLNSSASDRLKAYCKRKSNFDFEQIDFDGVFRLLTQPQRQDEKVQLKIVDKQYFDRIDGDIQGLIACVEINSFLDAIIDENTKSIKRYLFDDNIRAYLGDEFGYNREIIASALHSDNFLFWYCNNGITIVCDDYVFQRETRNPVLTVSNFQVVNGAQTCHSLLKARDLNSLSVSNALVMVRIYKTRRREFISRIALATNSQNRISLRDLHANDDVQKAIEGLFIGSEFFYERKRNQHFEQPQRQRVDALTFGQLILAYRLRQPDRARRESDDIFGSLYNTVFNTGISSEYALGVVRLHRYVEERCTRILNDDGAPKFERFKDIIRYGTFHVLFVISLICQSKGIVFPPDGEIDEFVNSAIKAIDTDISKYKTISNYDMFRSPRLRERLERVFSGSQLELPLHQ